MWGASGDGGGLGVGLGVGCCSGRGDLQLHPCFATSLRLAQVCVCGRGGGSVWRGSVWGALPESVGWCREECTSLLG